MTDSGVTSQAGVLGVAAASDEHRRVAWERATDWPLTGVAIAFLAAYALPILNQHLTPAVTTALNWVTWTTWALFAVDYFARWHLSIRRRSFVLANLADLAVIVLPLLRPLRMLRLVTLLGRISSGSAVASLRGRIAVYVSGATSLILFCAALAVLDAERRNPQANIRTFGDAVWWAVTTVTTVGYGDRYPTTGEGRIVAGLLMLGGVALLSIVTATLATWLLDRVRAVEEQAQSATRADIRDLTDEIHRLRAEVAALREG